MRKNEAMKKAAIICALSAGVLVAVPVYAAEEETSHELDDYHLEEVIVEAKKNSSDDTYRYAKEESSVGILGEKEVKDTPFDVMTLNEKAIESFGLAPEGLSSVLSLDPSVNASANTSSDQVTIRGISINGHAMYLNGIPGMFGQYRMATNFIDGVDIMSGPGTGYNGTSYSSSAGGTVNLQSKKAQMEANGEATFTFSGRGTFEEKIDIGKRFGKDDRYGIRINALHTDGEISIPSSKLEQNNFFVNLDQKTEDSESNLLIGYLINHQKSRQKAASFKNSVTDLPDAPDADTNFAPDWAYDDHDNQIVTFNHKQKLSENTYAFLNAGYHKEDWYGYCAGSPSVFNNNSDFTSSFENCPLALTKKYLQVGFQGEFNLGKVKNEYVVSLDRNWYDYWIDSKQTSPSKFSGNLYERIDWAAPIVPSVDLNHRKTKAQMNGWAIFDTLTTPDERLALTLGVHGHEAEVNNFNVATGAKLNRVDSDGVCPTIGLVYKINPKLNVYANHTENFGMGTLVSTSYENQGDMLDPNKTKQNEVGFKYKNGNFLHTLSAFDIKKANNIDVYVDGVAKPYLMMDGEQRNKGIEYKAVGEISKKINLIGGFMYLDARQAKTTKGISDGLKVNGAPNWSATLGLEYKATEELSLLFRSVYAGSATINNETLDVPGYMKFDIGAKYKTTVNDTPVTLSAMCYNVTDKNYWQASAGSSSLYLGSPRTFMLSASFEF